MIELCKSKLPKFKYDKLNISEFTVLVKVRIESLNDFSKPILSNTKKLDKIKRLRKKGQSIALESANPAYETRILAPHRVKVQGKLIGLLRKY